MENENEYIPVVARFEENGEVLPLAIEWRGHNINIDKVLSARLAPSLKHGGQGMRYTIRIRDTRCYLFCDNGKWFLEKIC